MKALKVTISGSYRGADNKIFDFSNLEGVIPFCEKEWAEHCIKTRYAKMWITKDDKFKERVTTMREVYLDKVEEVETNFSYAGKDIKEMSFEELQDLATAKALRDIPLYKASSLREAQAKSYAIYSEKLLGNVIKDAAKNFAELPSIIVDASSVSFSNELEPSEEQRSGQLQTLFEDKKTLSLDDLKKIAKQRGIPIAGNLSYDNLYKKIFN